MYPKEWMYPNFLTKCKYVVVVIIIANIAKLLLCYLVRLFVCSDHLQINIVWISQILKHSEIISLILFLIYSHTIYSICNNLKNIFKQSWHTFNPINQLIHSCLHLLLLFIYLLISDNICSSDSSSSSGWFILPWSLSLLSEKMMKKIMKMKKKYYVYIVYHYVWVFNFASLRSNYIIVVYWWSTMGLCCYTHRHALKKW